MIRRHHVKRMEVYGVVAAALLPLLIRDDAFRHLLVIAGIYGIAALGLSLFMGFAGQISIGHSAFMGIGGYTTAVLATRFGVPPAA
jgi:branched-chain amino acid transport system permease protein